MSETLLTAADISGVQDSWVESFRDVDVAGYWLKHIQPGIVIAAQEGREDAWGFGLPPFFIAELYKYGEGLGFKMGDGSHFIKIILKGGA